MIVSDSFVIADWKDPGTHPGRPIAGLHLHRSDDEAWIVLEGRLGFRIGEEEREVPAGESMLVTRGTPHRGRRLDPEVLPSVPTPRARKATLRARRTWSARRRRR
jgi:quercetin dioxygenase-like cupin family protein